MIKSNYRIAVVGLGYVGLPLAVEFSKVFNVTGFDINQKRIQNLMNGVDHTLEVDSAALKEVLKACPCDKKPSGGGLFCTSKIEELKNCNVYIITVPTPVDKYNRPDLTPLLKASETVSKVLKEGDLVIYESTVYPGVTEEECVPVLEKYSGLIFNVDFFCGYSPERINPGDKEHTVAKIKKITSGSTPEIAEIVDCLYKSIITAGTHKASSIKVAEAAKVIENAQRDINIAFVNELSKIFNRLNIDTEEVLAAAGTKWNFLSFKPGLVGGHCIGVDPYYLAQKAQETGYHPEVILAGRRLNDSMGGYIADQVVHLMVKKRMHVVGSKALVMGITFKENCPDVRNTKVIDIIKQLRQYQIDVDIYDPWANPEEVFHEYGIRMLEEPPKDCYYDAVVLAVAHKVFKYENIKRICCDRCVLFDVKSVLCKELADARL